MTRSRQTVHNGGGVTASLVAGQENLYYEIRDIRGKVDQLREPKTSNQIALAMMILGIIGLVGAPIGYWFVSSVGEVKRDMALVRTEFYSNSRDIRQEVDLSHKQLLALLAETNKDVRAWHDRALALEFARGQLTTQISSLDSLAKKLDIDLQREMRDVNATTEAKLLALDNRLQDEMKRTASFLTENRKAMEETVGRLRDFKDTATGVHAAHDEKLRTLERQVFFNK